MMRIWNSNETPNEGPYAVTIGSYDGIHKGHKEIIQNLADNSKKSLLITFEPHPKAFFMNSEFRCLTSMDEKIQSLADTDLTDIWIVDFNDRLANLNHSEFIASILEKIEVSHLAVGEDFRFGKNRTGDTGELKKWCDGNDISIDVLGDVTDGSTKISSTLIREKISKGEIGKANELLGSEYSISGTVVKGSGRGGGIGFPTANIKISGDKQEPGYGVYCGKIQIDEKAYRAAINYGTRKTFGEGDVWLEVHILDFDQIIYGKDVKIFLAKKIREEQKFENIDELKGQISRDIETCRKG